MEIKPYVGAYTGFNSLTGENSEADKNGMNLGAFGMVSFLREDMVFDTSLGYQYNRMSGSSSASKVTVSTQTLFLDLDARWRLNSKWSVGPTLSSHFNQAGIDNSLSEEEKKSGSRFINVNLGVKIAHDTTFGSQDVRFYAAALTNVNDRDRSNMIVNFGVAFAIPEKNNKPVVASKPVIKKEYKTYAKPEEADVKVTLKFARVGFETNAYMLDSKGKTLLTKLGKSLAKNKDLFDRVKVSGHTDSRGGKEYNQKLSQDRADSVMKVFVEAGVPEKKIQSFGYGLSRPVDAKETAEAWEKNRRTEIEFFGVTDRNKLNKILEESLK